MCMSIRGNNIFMFILAKNGDTTSGNRFKKTGYQINGLNLF